MPFGFPSGQILADLIWHSLLLKDSPIRNMDNQLQIQLKAAFEILSQAFDKKELATFADHLAGEESIDAFLEHQTDDFIKIGKAAIAATLLPFENTVELEYGFMLKRLLNRFDEEAKEHLAVNNWYQLLWRALSCPFDEFQENKLRIITFNYDRSLEHYLYTRLERRYPGKQKSEYITKMPDIAHIHGRLGYLPWQKEEFAQQSDCIPYNAMYDAGERESYAGEEYAQQMRQWFEIAENMIKVIHEDSKDEGSKETVELKQARGWIHQCQHLYFLGFGYHPSNIDRLAIESMNSKRIYGTTSGLSKSQRQYVTDLIQPVNRLRGLDTFFDKHIYEALHDNINLE